MVKNAYAEIGYELLSKEYTNNHTKLHIRCDKNHEYWGVWSNSQRGSRCPHCAGKYVDIEQIRNTLAKIGHKLISTEYINNKTKMEIECDRQHRYQRAWKDIRKRKTCPVCADRKITWEKVDAAAKEAGHKLISKGYVNSNSKLIFECPESHQYKLNWNSFNGGQRCSYCAGKHVDLEQVKQEYAEIGYTVLSKKYINTGSKLLIKCDRSHIFSSSRDCMKMGRRCPDCAEYGGFNQNKPGNLYYLKIATPNGVCYKIGVSNDPPEKRISQLGYTGYDITLIWSQSFLFGRYAYEKEQEILKQHKEFRPVENIYNLRSGFTEVFNKDVLGFDSDDLLKETV